MRSRIFLVCSATVTAVLLGALGAPASASPVADSTPAASVFSASIKDASTIRISVNAGAYAGSTWGKGATYPGPCRVKVRDNRKKKMLLSARVSTGSQTLEMKKASLRKGRYDVTASISCPKRVVKVTDDGPAYRVRFTKVTGAVRDIERANGYGFDFLG